MHFRQSHKKRYAGRVLDGPHEGDWIEEDKPFFEAYWQRQLRPAPISVNIPSVTVEVDRAYYRWLHGYRAWAWMQPEEVLMVKLRRRPESVTANEVLKWIERNKYMEGRDRTLTQAEITIKQAIEEICSG